MRTQSTLAVGCERYLAAFFLFILCLSSAPTRSQPLPDRRDFVGRVVDDDGQPLAGATITIRPPTDLGIGSFWGAQTVTDENGEFRVPDVEDGIYNISVEQGGFAPLRSSTFTLSRSSPRLDATLIRLVNFQVRVLKTDGEPLTGSPLSVHAQGADQEVSSVIRRLSTDANGIASLTNLVPGRYEIYLIAPEAGFAVVPATAINRATVQETPDVRLQSGGQLQISARRQEEKGPGPQLGGALLTIKRLSETEGTTRPEEEVGMFLANSDRYALVTDERGQMRFEDVPVGRYQARLLMPGFEAPALQEISVRSGQEVKLEFTLVPNAPLSKLKMTLQDESGKPAASQQWRLMMRQLSGVGGAPPPPLPGGGDIPHALLVTGSMRRGQTDAQGLSVLDSLAPGRWNFVLTLVPDKPNSKKIPAFTQRVDVPAEGGDATIKIRGLKLP